MITTPSTDATVTLPPDQVTARLSSDLPAWSLGEGCIQRVYKTDGWAHTLLLVNAIGYLCEAACHHPALVVSYQQVTVKLSTHEPRGITEKDLELARLIESRVLWHPAPGAALEGYERGFKKPWIK
jgi:pterin-4a-carbinolamine dehydratase